MNLKGKEISRLTVALSGLALFAVLAMGGVAIPAQAQTYNINFPAPTTFRVVENNGCEYCPSTIAVATGDFNGDGNLDVVNIAIDSIALGGADPGDFSETNTCGSSRKAGWGCTITVTFKPTATGARSATLNIKDSVGTQTVQLSGTGE